MPAFRMRLSALAPVVVVACLLAPAAAGAATDEEIGATFRKADVNSDGFLDIDEYMAFMVRLFAARDTNRDGLLVPAEVPEAGPERVALFDRNKDGRVSLGEGVGGKVVEFFDADTNRDGVLTLDELLAFERTLKRN